MDLSSLQPGQRLFQQALSITQEASAAYREAVDDGCEIHAAERLVPPMAVAALVMGQAMRDIALPAGAVHTGQELFFADAVPEGASLACEASVAQNSVRGGVRFLTLDVRASKGDAPAVVGLASIVVQEAQE